MRLLPALICLSASLAAATAGADDPEHRDCAACAQWSAPVDPFLLAPNTWYVGSAGLSAVLIDSGAGLVLIDGGLPQSAAAIATAMRRLGFAPHQLRFILNSHAHFDHAGGIAALARWSGARVLASQPGAAALRRGDVDADDPQAGFGEFNRFPPVPQAEGLADGGSLSLGSLNITLHHTPGHTPGGASWSWQACDANGGCLDVVYADSLTAVAAPGYRFLDHPEPVAALRASIQRVAGLDCDVIVAAHPGFVELFERRERGSLVEADGCRRYAEAALRRLEQRLASEAAGS